LGTSRAFISLGMERNNTGNLSGSFGTGAPSWATTPTTRDTDAYFTAWSSGLSMMGTYEPDTSNGNAKTSGPPADGAPA